MTRVLPQPSLRRDGNLEYRLSGTKLNLQSYINKFPGSDSLFLPNRFRVHNKSKAFYSMPQSDFESCSLSTDSQNLPESSNCDLPVIRSGSYASIGGRLRMEDAHFLIDDLSSHNSSTAKPTSLYGVYDGHGGCGASAYVRNNVPRLLVEDTKILDQSGEIDEKFLEEVSDSLRRAYLRADNDLADDPDIGFRAGTTALTAVIVGRHLVVANTGDCRAVLSRKGKAINMSIDHRPDHPSERKRIESLGSFITREGYLEGVLGVSRAMGDWDMKLRPGDTPSPLISDPYITHCELSEDDELLIMACDGVWDVMSSQGAVAVARRSLSKYDSPERCAKDLVKRALVMGSLDNLTVVVVTFTSPKKGNPKSPESRKIRWSSLGLSCGFKGLL